MPDRTLFKDRRDAGRQLATRLAAYQDRSDVLVVALPRGGVPVGFELAKALNAPLDVLVVCKIRVPGEDGLGLGAVASGGATFVNKLLVKRFGVSDDILADLTKEARREVVRLERAYRGHRPELTFRDRVVILVDDGVATGATVRAGVRALKQLGPARLVVAVPTANPDTYEDLAASVNEVVCLAMPEPYLRVGPRYQHFPDTSNDEVRMLLDMAQRNFRRVDRNENAP